jgi:hypothetical protein
MAGFVKTKGRADGGDTIKGSLNASSSMPKGSTAQRPSSSKSGDMRFNTDLGKMEYFDGSAFVAYSKEGFIAITQDSFTGDGSTTAFTMSKSVESNQEQRVVVAVGNVYQNPASAYTVSGTTITFTSAPAGSETITVIHGYDSTTH